MGNFIGCRDVLSGVLQDSVMGPLLGTTIYIVCTRRLLMKVDHRHCSRWSYKNNVSSQGKNKATSSLTDSGCFFGTARSVTFVSGRDHCQSSSTEEQIHGYITTIVRPSNWPLTCKRAKRRPLLAITVKLGFGKVPACI